MILKIGDWGLGIGDWGLAQSPIPNPQSPINLNLNKFINYTYLKTYKLVKICLEDFTEI